MRKTIRTSKKEFHYTVFIELFMVYLLGIVQDFIVYLSRDICEIENVTILWISCSKENTTFF